MRRYPSIALAVLALAVLALAGLVVSGCTRSADQLPATAPHGLADCGGHPQAEPSLVDVMCANNSLAARDLRWSDWGKPVAVATGTAVVDSCAFEDCYNGVYVSNPVVLVVSGVERCPDGSRAYARIQYLFVGHFTGWPPSELNNVVSRPCG